MKSENNVSTRFESGILMVGVILLSICAYLLGSMDERVRAVDKIENGKVGDKEFREEYQRFSAVMAEIIVQIDGKYVEDVDPERLFKAALNGVFDALDPHSSYLGPENFQALEKSTEGAFSGIGVQINVDRYGILTVVSPIPGTPAARAGLRAWDRIVEIEGESTEGMSTIDAVKVLTGPEGTLVNFLVYRPGVKDRIPFTIERSTIKIESVYSNMDNGDHVTPYFKHLREKKIGYVRLTQFSEHISTDLRNVLDKMKRDKMQGLILDLRYNTGGLLVESIKVSDLFLNKGDVVVVTKGRLKEQNREYKCTSGKETDLPMIVLVNESSASASEILAGALQDHRRAVLVGPEGRNTYGKALVQTISPLSTSLENDKDGKPMMNAIRLTTAKYYTPNNAGEDGKSLHLIGIVPDVRIEIPDKHRMDLLTKGWLLGDPISIEPTEEEALEQATESTKEEKKTPEAKTREPLADEEEEDDTPFYLRKKHIPVEEVPQTEDIQLKYSIDLLRGILFAGGQART